MNQDSNTFGDWTSDNHCAQRLGEGARRYPMELHTRAELSGPARPADYTHIGGVYVKTKSLRSGEVSDWYPSPSQQRQGGKAVSSSIDWPTQRLDKGEGEAGGPPSLDSGYEDTEEIILLWILQPNVMNIATSWWRRAREWTGARDPAQERVIGCNITKPWPGILCTLGRA